MSNKSEAKKPSEQTGISEPAKEIVKLESQVEKPSEHYALAISPTKRKSSFFMEYKYKYCS